MAELFGFKIERLKEPSTDPRQNIVPPQADDGTQTVPAGGFFASYGGFDVAARNELDLIRRRANILRFDYSSNDARYIDMSGNPRNLEDNPHTPAFRRDTFTDENARTFMVFRDYTRNGDIPSTLNNDLHISDIISNRVSYYHHLHNTMIAASLKGRIDLRPGKIINLDIKQLNGAGTVEVNDTLSGKYLIKTVSHKRGMDGVLNTGLQLIKFDWSGTDVSPSNEEWTVG